MRGDADQAWEACASASAAVCLELVVSCRLQSLVAIPFPLAAEVFFVPPGTACSRSLWAATLTGLVSYEEDTEAVQAWVPEAAETAAVIVLGLALRPGRRRPHPHRRHRRPCPRNLLALCVRADLHSTGTSVLSREYRERNIRTVSCLCRK